MNYLEDAWQTKNSYIKQVAGVVGFLFTNAFLAYKHFQKSASKHSQFKVNLANALTRFKEAEPKAKRLSLYVVMLKVQRVHVLKF